jgi:DNA-directed RNA polymerase specialized sigma subunit
MDDLPSIDPAETLVQRAKAGDDGALNDLLKHYEPNIRSLVLSRPGQQLQTDGETDYETDYQLQVARLAFCDAVRRYNPDHLRRNSPEQGASFQTYAISLMRGALRYTPAETDEVELPRADRALREKLRRIGRAMASELKRAPTMEEIARRARTPIDKASILLNASAATPATEQKMISFADSDDDEADTDDADGRALSRRGESTYYACLDALPTAMHQRLFKLRYGRLLVGQEPLTLEHAAREAGFVKGKKAKIEDARALETEGLDILRSGGLMPWS